ncbi:hypothetical protein [Micromonospora gifhornensis]|uniref:hypothetical protein n=1 Tax=Micromonospora gifhornensis TaxID=84594 RepID=UPI00256F1D55|nr:hypothetical protein [Verrucosispora sp. FIM060022]
MGQLRTALAVTGVLGAALLRTVRTAVVRRLRRRSRSVRRWPEAWQVVAIARPPGEVLPEGVWPEPLRRLDGAIQVELRSPPDGRRTELAARPVTQPAPTGLAAHLIGDEPQLAVRHALWQAKQLAESGELPPTGRDR